MDAAFEALPGNGPGAHEAWAAGPRRPAAHAPTPRLNNIESAERRRGEGPDRTPMRAGGARRRAPRRLRGHAAGARERTGRWRKT